MAWSAEDWMIHEAGEEAPETCSKHGEEIDEESGTCLLCAEAVAEAGGDATMVPVWPLEETS